jgi:hypothetical protein
MYNWFVLFDVFDSPMKSLRILGGIIYILVRLQSPLQVETCCCFSAWPIRCSTTIFVSKSVESMWKMSSCMSYCQQVDQTHVFHTHVSVQQHCSRQFWKSIRKKGIVSLSMCQLCFVTKDTNKKIVDENSISCSFVIVKYWIQLWTIERIDYSMSNEEFSSSVTLNPRSVLTRMLW